MPASINFLLLNLNASFKEGPFKPILEESEIKLANLKHLFFETQEFSETRVFFPTFY